MTRDETAPSGVPFLDERMEGFRTGDNVILEVDVATPPYSFLLSFMRAALARGDRVVYASFDRSPATIVDSLASLPRGDVVVLDAFTEGKGRGESVFRSFYDGKHDHGRQVIRSEYPHRPLAFHEEFDAASGAGRGSFLVVDSLTGMRELWGGEERVQAFYTHTCPRLYDTRAIAVWVASRAVHSPEFLAAIGHVAQVVLELDGQGPQARVVRATGRRLREGDAIPYVDDGATVLPRERAAKR